MKNIYYDGSAENRSLSLTAALLIKSIIKTPRVQQKRNKTWTLKNILTKRKLHTDVQSFIWVNGSGKYDE